MKKFTSFVDFQITVYRGSRAVEIVPKAKNRVLKPMEMAGNDEIHEFVDFQITVYRGSRTVEIIPGAKKPSAIAHENGLK